MQLFESNINEIVLDMSEHLFNIDTDEMTREQCFTLLSDIRKRVHQDGLNSNNSPIGQYDSSYLARRMEKFNRTGDADVILSLTRQMESDYIVFPVEGGNAIGFNNAENLKKALINERRYGVPIFEPTQQEKETVYDIIDKYI
jgi:hypothetical protein